MTVSQKRRAFMEPMPLSWTLGQLPRARSSSRIPREEITKGELASPLDPLRRLRVIVLRDHLQNDILSKLRLHHLHLSYCASHVMVVYKEGMVAVNIETKTS